jgi:hypothetical protein
MHPEFTGGSVARMTLRGAVSFLFALAGLNGAAGCFDPEIRACLRCPTGHCPSGQQCLQGYCSKPGRTCAAAAPEPCRDGRCCLGNACFDFGPGTAPALWLDWTSVRPPDPSRNADLEVWRDRSGLEHHADPIVGPFNHRPVVGGPTANTALVRMRFGDEGLLVQQPASSILRALGNQDFLMLIAATLDCTPAEEGQCLAQKQGIVPDPTGGREGRGFWVRAVESELQGQFDVQGWFTGIEAGSARTSGLSLRCDEFHLFGVRRTAREQHGEWQVRVNGSVVVATPIPVGVSGAPPNTPLQFAGGSACGFLEGSLAAAVVVDGAFDDRQTCELERFLLARLHEAFSAATPSTSPCE